MRETKGQTAELVNETQPNSSLKELDYSLGLVLSEMEAALKETDAAVDEAEALTNRLSQPFFIGYCQPVD